MGAHHSVLKPREGGEGGDRDTPPGNAIQVTADDLHVHIERDRGGPEAGG